MKSSFEQTLIEVWRQALVENATMVKLGGKRYAVHITPRKGLRQVDFTFEGNEIRGLEQNPEYEVPMGTDGTLRQEGDAVSQRGPLRSERSGLEK